MRIGTCCGGRIAVCTQLNSIGGGTHNNLASYRQQVTRTA